MTVSPWRRTRSTPSTSTSLTPSRTRISTSGTGQTARRAAAAASTLVPSGVWATPDVWNRGGTSPGAFPNDQPDNEPAGNGAGAVGENWAFARTRRRAPAAPGGTTMVAAHFLVSKLELAATSLTPAQPIPTSPSRTPDPTVTFGAIDVGPVTATPFHWHLNPVSSSHLCLAVEISAPNDPLCGTEPARPRTRVARAIGRTSCRLPKAPRGPRGGSRRPGRRHHAGRASPPAGASAGRRLSALACDTFGGPER